MEVLKECVGIDVSKDTLACCIGKMGSNEQITFGKPKSFPNNLKGFEDLKIWVDNGTRTEVVFVMEATGVYYENLAYWLDSEGYKVCVMLPNKVKYFSRSLNVKTKTDNVDSQVLSRIGLERKLSYWQMPSGCMREIKFLCRECREIKSKIVVAKNQLHAKNHSHRCPETVIARLKREIAMFETQLLEIELELHQVVGSDIHLANKISKIETIPGVSFMTIVCILAETNAFALMTNARQLVSYSGLDIQHNQSGPKEGKTRISKKGNSFIRHALYMPALSATRCNLDMKVFYDRLTARKPAKKIAVTAVARKLLILVYTLWKNDTIFKSTVTEPLEKEVGRY